MMKPLEIRPARLSDTEKVQWLCRLLESEDYVVNAWPRWIHQQDAINLVALQEGKLVACWHAEPITESDAWSQGTRVHPDFQGRGIGSLMLDRLEAELRRRNFRVIRGSIDPSNFMSLALVKSRKWRVHSSVCRRQCEPHQAPVSAIEPADRVRVSQIADKLPLLGSKQHLAHYRRAYFTMTENHLLELVDNNAVFVSEDSQAYAILDDAYRNDVGVCWVVGIVGSYEAKFSLIKDLMNMTYRQGKRLLFDSPCHDQFQSALDEIGFEPVLCRGHYVIVERWL